jgi:hypothetical protein
MLDLMNTRISLAYVASYSGVLDALLAAHSSHKVNQGHEVACSVQRCMSEEALNGTEMMYWGKNTHPHF